MARKAAPRPRTLRFPCGHLEAEGSADARMRGTPRAAWVACRQCNLIALTIVAAPAEAPARLRRPAR